MNVARFLGTVLVVSLIGPLVWLFAEWLANVLRSWGYRVARGWRTQKARAKQRLS